MAVGVRYSRAPVQLSVQLGLILALAAALASITGSLYRHPGAVARR